jgi:hypothetical protein
MKNNLYLIIFILVLAVFFVKSTVSNGFSLLKLVFILAIFAVGFFIDIKLNKK